MTLTETQPANVRAARRTPTARRAARRNAIRSRGSRRSRSYTFSDLAAPIYVIAYLLLIFEPNWLIFPIPAKVLSLLMPPVGLLILLLTPTHRLARLPIMWTLVAFIGWVTLSWSWSELPRVTFDLIRLQLVPLVLVALIVGTIPPRRIVRILLIFMIGVCAWSLLISIAWPPARAAVLSAGPDGNQAGFRGTFGHKNTMGIFAVYTLCLVLPFVRSKARIPVVALCVVLVLSTRSATAASGLMAVAFVWFWIAAIDGQKTARDRQFLGVVSLASALVAILLAFGLMPALLGVYDKDLTFSGRVFIWAESLNTWARQPIQGYGFGGVWWDGRAPVTADLQRRIGFGASHAHNGAIELLITVGVVGLALFAAFLYRTFRLALHAFGRPPMAQYGQWGILTVIAMLLMSVSEPLFRTPDLGLLTIIAVVLTNLRNRESVHELPRHYATTF